MNEKSLDQQGLVSPPLTSITSWGRYPRVDGRLLTTVDHPLRARSSLTRGAGRSYGDAALPADAEDVIFSSLSCNHIVAFDEASGKVTAESGVTVHDLEQRFLTDGWALPVTPGTAAVTLGGMVAADVHGKNHHRAGSFGDHVTSLRMLVADGRQIDCSPTKHPELFRATIGGMGLTGHILTVECMLERISSPWIDSQRVPCRDLMTTLEVLDTESQRWPFTVAWLDALGRAGRPGRGIVFTGRWAEAGDRVGTAPGRPRSRRIPRWVPPFSRSTHFCRLFNRAYYWRNGRPVANELVDARQFFHPLDAVENWNQLYGSKGFIQYQCVLPETAENGCKTARFFDHLAALGAQSHLAVIKNFGGTGIGMLSFPRPGTTISLDFPMRGDDTRQLVRKLNEFVIAEGGCIYLAKDALTDAEQFRSMEPRLAEWNRVRRLWDPQGQWRSALSRRLLDDPGR